MIIRETIHPILHHSERSAANDSFPRRWIVLRATALFLLSVESFLLIVNLVRAVFAWIAKSLLLFGAQYSQTLRKWCHARRFEVQPWERFYACVQLFMGATSSAVFGWSFPDVNLALHRRLPEFALTKLNLSTSSSKLFPRRSVHTLSEMPQIKTLYLSQRTFDKKTFSLLCEEILAHPTLKEIRVTRSLLSQSQCEELQKVCSQKKGLKITTSQGGPLGSIYTDWHEYNVKKENAYLKGMRETSVQALFAFIGIHGHAPKHILDFGAGTGQDAIPMTQWLKLIYSDFHVTALDGEKEALMMLQKHLTADLRAHVTCVSSPFKDWVKPHEMDILISSFTWPYRIPEEFDACWKKCGETLKKDGIIAGHFFGPRSHKARDSGMTYHTEKEVRELLHSTGFSLLWFKKEPEGSDFNVIGGNGAPAWGDLYHIVARKIQ